MIWYWCNTSRIFLLPPSSEATSYFAAFFARLFFSEGKKAVMRWRWGGSGGGILMPNKLADAPLFLICWNSNGGLFRINFDTNRIFQLSFEVDVAIIAATAVVVDYLSTIATHTYTYVYKPCVCYLFSLFLDFIFHFSFLSFFHSFWFCWVLFSKEINTRALLSFYSVEQLSMIAICACYINT